MAAKNDAPAIRIGLNAREMIEACGNAGYSLYIGNREPSGSIRLQAGTDAAPGEDILAAGGGDADVKVSAGYSENVIGFGWSNGVYLKLRDLLQAQETR